MGKTTSFVNKTALGALALGALFLSACANETATMPSQPAYQPPVVQLPPAGPPALDPTAFIRMSHMGLQEPVRVALLLPLGAESRGVRTVAQSLQNAAQLALFEYGNANVLLITKDTKGRADTARSAADEAIHEGADIILGPLFAQSVSAVAPVARERDVPVIAFSTDATVAGEGVYLLSFLPEQDVTRVVDYATQTGLTRFAGMIPQKEYGTRVSAAYRQAVEARGGVIAGMETYPADPQAMFDPARRLAGYNQRKAALKAERARLTSLDTPEAKSQLRRLENFDTIGDVNFDAVLIPAGGDELRSAAPLLPYFDIDPRKVQFLGTGLWDDAALGREPALVGGWYAAPPRSEQKAFVSRYRKTFGARPPRIASLAYDATSLAAALADGVIDSPYAATVLTDPEGFAGTDGIFRFLADGTNERGLAVMEVRPNGAEVISPAPQSFQPQAF
ncbi:MAG: ABC-type branched-subunit amino acid transport system substrate-binding protein [Parvibaculaceae bacterium]|nr:penicillin-binding protein activator [Parvibaculaceae bacterium]